MLNVESLTHHGFVTHTLILLKFATSSIQFVNKLGFWCLPISLHTLNLRIQDLVKVTVRLDLGLDFGRELLMFIHSLCRPDALNDYVRNCAEVSWCLAHEANLLKQH